MVILSRLKKAFGSKILIGILTLILTVVAVATYFQTERLKEKPIVKPPTVEATQIGSQFQMSILVYSKASGQPVEGLNLRLQVEGDKTYLTAVTGQNGYGVFSLESTSRGKPAVVIYKDQLGNEHSNSILIPTYDQSVKLMID